MLAARRRSGALVQERLCYSGGGVGIVGRAESIRVSLHAGKILGRPTYFYLGVSLLWQKLASATSGQPKRSRQG